MCKAEELRAEVERLTDKLHLADSEIRRLDRLRVEAVGELDRVRGERDRLIEAWPDEFRYGGKALDIGHDYHWGKWFLWRDGSRTLYPTREAAVRAAAGLAPEPHPTPPRSPDGSGA